MKSLGGFRVILAEEPPPHLTPIPASPYLHKFDQETSASQPRYNAVVGVQSMNRIS